MGRLCFDAKVRDFRFFATTALMTRNLSPDNNFFEGGGRELELVVRLGEKKCSKCRLDKDKFQSALVRCRTCCGLGVADP